MQSVCFYDEADSSSALRVTVPGDSTASVPKPYVQVDTFNLPSLGVNIHSWCDHASRTAHVTSIDTKPSASAVPTKQLSLSYPQPCHAARLVALPSGPSSFCMVWATPAMAFLTTVTVSRRGQDVEFDAGKTTVANLGNNEGFVDMTVLPKVVGGDSVASLLVADAFSIRRVDVGIHGDQQETLWLAHNTSQKKRGGLFGFGGTTTTTVDESSEVVGVQAAPNGHIVVVRTNGDESLVAQIFVNPEAAQNSSNDVELDLAQLNDFGYADGVVILIGVAQSGAPKLAVLDVNDGSVWCPTVPHDCAGLRSFSRDAKLGTQLILWTLPQEMPNAPQSFLSLCAAMPEGAAEEDHLRGMLQITTVSGRGSKTQRLHVPVLTANAALLHEGHSVLANGTLTSSGSPALRLEVLVGPKALGVNEQVFSSFIAQGPQLFGSMQQTSAIVCSDIHAYDLEVSAATQEGLAAIASTPENLQLIQKLLHDAAINGGRTTHLDAFVRFSSQMHFVGLEPEVPVTGADVDQVITMALGGSSAAENRVAAQVFCAGSRRYLYNRVTADLLSRLVALVVAHIGWVCSGPGFLHDPIFKRLALAFDAVCAAYRAAVALGPTLAALVANDDFGGAAEPASASEVVAYFLDLDYSGVDTTLTSVAAKAADMLRVNSNPQTLRACSAWCSAWRTRFPFMAAFEVVVAVTWGRTGGAASNLILSNSLLAASHLASVEKSTAMELVHTMIDLLGFNEQDFLTDVAQLMNAQSVYAPQLFRVLLMRRFVTRADFLKVDCCISTSTLQPSFASDLDVVLQLVRHNYASLEFLLRFLEDLQNDTSVFLVRGALDDCNYQTAVSLLSQIENSSRRQLDEEQIQMLLKWHAKAIVLSAFGKQRGKELAQLQFTSTDIAHMLAVEMSTFIFSRGVPSNEADEARWVANVIAFHNFFSTRRSMGAAAKVAYRAATKLRSATHCTQRTLTYALQMMALAENSLQLSSELPIPKMELAAATYDADEEMGMGVPLSSTVGSGSGTYTQNPMQPFSREALPMIRRQLLQTDAERKLLMRSQRPIKMVAWNGEGDAAAARDVLLELMRVRLWEDAIRLAKAWDLELGNVFNTYALDLISAPCVKGIERDWQKLLSALRRESTVENNRCYLVDALCVMLNHANYRHIPQSIKDELRRDDPSAYIACCMQQSDRSTNHVSELTATEAVETARDFLLATIAGGSPADLEEFGFGPRALVTATMRDRVVLLSKKVLDRHQRGLQLKPELVAAAKDFQTVLKEKF